MKRLWFEYRNPATTTLTWDKVGQFSLLELSQIAQAINFELDEARAREEAAEKPVIPS